MCMLLLLPVGAESQTGSSTAGSVEIPSPTDLYSKIVRSVMTLQVKSSTEVRVGTGFVIDSNGLAVTSWHVVYGAQHVSARFSDGEEFEVSGLVDKDEQRDLALVRIKVFGKPALTLMPQDPKIGARTYAIGASEGLDFTFSEEIGRASCRE